MATRCHIDNRQLKVMKITSLTALNEEPGFISRDESLVQFPLYQSSGQILALRVFSSCVTVVDVVTHKDHKHSCISDPVNYCQRS